MAYLFDISQSGNTSLQIKPKQPVDMAFQVKNVSGRRIHARIYMKESTDTAKNGWVSIKGSKELLVDIEPGVVQAVTATVNVPQGASAGKSTFYLFAQDTDQPDEGDKSPAIALEVVPGPKPTTPPWMIPVIVAVALLVIGTGTWLVLRHPKQPDGGGTTTASKTKIAIPSVTGMKLGDAQAVLGYMKFAHVQLAPDLRGGSATPGMVYGQDPAPNTQATLDTPISLRFVPTSILVPTEMKGKDFGTAYAILQTAGLQFGGECCATSANTDQVVLRTDPAMGTPVDVGRKVMFYTTLQQSATTQPMTGVSESNLRNTVAYRVELDKSIALRLPIQPTLNLPMR